jgi:riboflavin kinase/FMN adenylyltransferase
MKQMEIYRHTKTVCQAANGSVVAIGNFDGLHLGHKKVLHTAKKEAEKLGLPLIVVTFEPHPIKALKPEIAPVRLTPFAAKAREMQVSGVDGIYVITFSKKYANTTPEQFVTDTIVNTLHAKHVFVGDDFSFGKGRSGSPEVLAELGKTQGFEVTAVPQHTVSGERVSSSQVRQSLQQGELDTVTSLLGRNYAVRTRFVETEMLTLVGYMHSYAPIKNGAYWCEVDYNGACFTLPVVVIGKKLTIPAIGDRPEVSDEVAEIRFVEVMQELKDAI